ncbi:MAG: ribbon-helix-helix protein, CopG family [Pirellulaceae bacterium]
MSGRISIRIPKKLEQGVQKLVQSTGKSESEIVRAALEDYCRRHGREPSCYDLASSAGILGCGSGPADLSSNPKFMEGFGK